MKKSLGSILALTLLASWGWSQPPRGRVVTQPKLPNREMLRRMDMDLHWSLKLPRFNLAHDGIFSVQVIPGQFYPQLLAQTIQGQVILIDGETGDILWSQKFDMVPTRDMLPCAYNSHSVYVVRGDYMYILERNSGVKLLWTFDPMTKIRSYFAFRLSQPPGSTTNAANPPLAKPAATPFADEDMLFYTAGDRIVALDVPNYRKNLENRIPLPVFGDSERPKADWILFTGEANVTHVPIVTRSQVAVAKTNGMILSLEKQEELLHGRPLKVGKISAAMGVHAISGRGKNEGTEMAYVPSEDQMLYAIDLVHRDNPEPTWRFVSPRPIRRKPYVNDRDVYIKVDGAGFYRLDRASGKAMWKNRDALQFMAANRLFVYTRNAEGSLLIHDYMRGTTMAEWDFRDWRMSVVNELNDRVYLANHDGQFICLRHHDYRLPQVMKFVDFVMPPPPPRVKAPK